MATLAYSKGGLMCEASISGQAIDYEPLQGLIDCRFRGLGQVRVNKARLWIQIVITRLIYYSNKACLCCVGIEQRLVNFSAFQRSWILGIIHAYYEFRFLHRSVKKALNLVLFSADASRLVPVYLCGTNRSILKLHHGDSLSLSPATFTISPP